MKLTVLECAERELAEAVEYYNRQCPGLGYELAAEVKRGFSRIQNHPDAWPTFSSRARRYLTDRFPYGILYTARNETILIAGIMHLRQDPKPWLERI
jgi:plasmid stabilization system protein ParE